MDEIVKISKDLEDDNYKDDLEINRDVNPWNEEAWKVLEMFLFLFYSSDCDLLGGQVGLMNNSLEIEVNWRSKNDGGGHLYMVIYNLITVSFY